MTYTVLALIVVANIVWSGYRLTSGLTGDHIMAFLVSLALFIMALSARTQTLTVQNRVVRLEMRHRFRELLPADVAARACALPIPQIVSLRFASDAELPELVNEVLSGQLTDAKAIKQRVKEWQADHLRA
jgi:hypothetical protein